jgi:hypothetical protein
MSVGECACVPCACDGVSIALGLGVLVWASCSMRASVIKCRPFIVHVLLSTAVLHVVQRSPRQRPQYRPRPTIIAAAASA